MVASTDELPSRHVHAWEGVVCKSPAASVQAHLHDSRHCSPPASTTARYFRNLLEFDWELHKGPGGKNQWRPKLKPGSRRTRLPAIMMLTADVALLKDPKYLALVKTFAADQKALDNAFKHGEAGPPRGVLCRLDQDKRAAGGCICVLTSKSACASSAAN
jgi:hypothetical protein